MLTDEEYAELLRRMVEDLPTTGPELVFVLHEALTQYRLNHMETGPLGERPVGDRRRVPDRRCVERRVQGERRNQRILMPVDLNPTVRGLDRRIIYRRTMIFRRSIEDRRLAASQ